MIAHRLNRLVTGVAQDERVRAPARLAGVAFLEMRGLVTERRRSPGQLRNVYGASLWKAGSQWAKALFEHQLVAEATGLAIFPQAVFDGRGFHNRFPARCYVHLYLSYPEYAALRKRPPYRTFYVARDPRDIVVSWYFSMRDTHRGLPRVHVLRRALSSMSESDGLLFSIRELAPSLSAMTTWLDAPPSEVAFFRLEDIAAHHDAETRRLLAHCEVGLSEDALRRVLADTSREALRGRDLIGRSEGEESHYRRQPSNYADHFEAVHYDLFRDLTGDLVERLGYA